jgi:predicted O-linked N-acetylglucosamine transferase (SPINDLY family)
LPALSALRAQLRQTVLQSPLYDAKQFAKHLTQALTQMWAAYRDRPTSDMKS